MANRSGQGPSLPRVNRNSLPVAAVPPVQIRADTAVANGMFSIGDMLRNMSGRIEQRLDVMADIEGRKAGTAAGLGETLPQLMDDATIRGRAYNIAAKDAAITRIDTQSRLYLSELESKHTANPGAFRQKADAYLNGQLTELAQFDPALAQRYENDFRLRADGASRRLEGQAQAVARDRMLEDALRLQQSAAGDIAQDAAGLFTAGPEAVQQGISRMMTSAVRMTDVASQIGPDGMPLFSARERLAFEQKAEETVASHVALAWMDQQENVLDAWDAWRSGAAKIAIGDGAGGKVDMPLRDMLGARAYQMAEGAFMERLRGQLTLEAQVNTARERVFKETSDGIYADLSVLAQGGTLQLQAVEDARGQLETERYLTLRKIAVGGFPEVSDGVTYTRLATADLDGEDIRADLRAAADKLTRDDFMRLYERNHERLQQGRRDPVTQGREYVSKSLGSMASEIGFVQSLMIAEAEAEYAQEIEKAAAENKDGRALSLSQTLEISRAVTERYSVINADQALYLLELPKGITNTERLSRDFNSQRMMEIIKNTESDFLKKHKNDVEKMEADPEYRKEMKLLKKHLDIINYKEQYTVDERKRK